MKRLFAILVAVILCLSATSPVTAADPERPFRGSLSGVDAMEDPTGVCPADASWLYVSRGTGRFTHLGLVATEVRHCTWMDWETGTGVFANGTMTFVAANGDRLVLRHEGSFHLVFDASGQPVLSIIDDLRWEIVGGTGRFVDASGSGTASPIGHLGPIDTTSAPFVGTIAY